MEAAEGKLFKPLAFTKTFALIASLIIALLVIPTYALTFFNKPRKKGTVQTLLYILVTAAGIITLLVLNWWIGLALVTVGLYHLAVNRLPERYRILADRSLLWLSVITVYRDTFPSLAGH